MIKTNGFFYLHRSIFLNPIVTKNPDYFIVWVYILSQAEYEPGRKVDFGGKTIELKPGQFTIGISGQMLHDLQGIDSTFTKSRLFRILKRFKSETQIETERSGKCTLFTVVNWDKYQKSGTQNGTKKKQKRNGSETAAVTKEEYKEDKKKEEKTPPVSDEKILKPGEVDEEGWVQH